MLPVPLVIVPPIVVGIEEPVLEDQLVGDRAVHVGADLVDERVDEGLHEVPVVLRQGVGVRVGVFGLPAALVVSGKVEVDDLEGIPLGRARVGVGPCVGRVVRIELVQ